MTEIAKEYGTGLYELAQEENLTRDLLDELKTLSSCLAGEPDFCRLLGNMSLGKAERLSILDKTLRGQVHPYLLNFMKLLCERGALTEFADCVKAYSAKYDEAHGVVEAAVTTSQPLTDDQRKRLMDKLGQMTGHEVRLKEKLDKTVIDGVLLEMNGQRYDNTVRQHLRAIRSALSAES
ncbi:MAG: ATP synthase F1 subunit delta [Eubacteriales bacterium]|nr:ATP synthase F1 subunit delta [Eubacteriales bacterium]